MRRRHRATAFWLTVLVAIGVWGATAGPAAAGGRESCNGDPSLCGRRLNEVVLAATHNSMSAQSLGWQIPNQQVGIPDQLRLGVRGFLLDTYYAHREPNGTVVNDPTPTAQSQIYLCHVLCQLGATPLVDVLRSMRDFLRANPSNVLVIVNEDSVSPTDFAAVVESSGLLQHVYKGEPGPKWPKLRKMIRRSEQVVLLAERQSAPVPWYHQAYSGILQETPYNWPALSQLTDPSNWPESCRPFRGGTTGSLFLMNHWSPPVAPTPATSAVVNATDTIVGRASTCAYVRGAIPNIVAVDLFQSGGLLQAVAELNRRFAPARPG